MLLDYTSGFLVGNDHHSHSHIEGVQHLSILKVANISNRLEDWKYANPAKINNSIKMFRQDTGQVSFNSSAGDMCYSVKN